MNKENLKLTFNITMTCLIGLIAWMGKGALATLDDVKVQSAKTVMAIEGLGEKVERLESARFVRREDLHALVAEAMEGKVPPPEVKQALEDLQKAVEDLEEANRRLDDRADALELAVTRLQVKKEK